MREMKKAQTNGKIPMLWIGRINIFKMTMLPKAIYRSKIISFKILMLFFSHNKREKILKFVWNQKRPQSSKAFWEKRIKLAVSHFLISKYITKL